MRVFVTGASGFIGSAIVQELLGTGHQVLGLARSAESAKALTDAGAEVHLGSVTDLESLKSGIAAADGVIHTAFIHDFTKFKESCEIDRKAIMAMGEALAGSDKPLVITSGTALVSSAKIAVETDEPSPLSPNPRVATEQAAAAVAATGVKVMVVRLPPSVHGDGDHGFVPMLINVAREKGAAAYVGDGQNIWPAVHRFDAAVLYRLALEKGTAGAKYHGNAEGGVHMRDIATIIGKRLNVPVVSKTTEEAAGHFGWIAHFAAINNPASSQQTREQLGWEPTHIGLIEDMDLGTYFG